MRPNGRRRWRGYAKKHRWLERFEGRYRVSAERFRKTHRGGHLSRVFAIPPRPWSARSLVGMSQRRRKQLFHRDFDAARETDGTNAGAVSMFVADALLAKYRIGQRLRPCPGCCACKSNRPTLKRLKKSYSVLARQIWERRPWVCGVLLVDNEEKVRTAIVHRADLHCDGSGVLPARRRP